MKSSQVIKEFDLSSLSADYRRGDVRARRILLTTISAVGMVLAIADALSFSGVFRFGSTRPETVPLFLIVGAVMVLAGLISLTKVHDAALALCITNKGFCLKGDKGVEHEFAWANIHRPLTILDWRSVPKERKSKAMQRVDLILTTDSPLDAVLSEEAVRSLLAAAKDHKCTVEGWTENPEESTGVIQIVPRDRA